MRPFGTQLHLTCTGDDVKWLINIPSDGRNVAISSNSLPEVLLRYNITLMRSRLRIPPDLVLQLDVVGAQINSGSNFTCQGLVGSEEPCVSEELTLIFFGMTHIII